jgi:hypothetical protein
MTIQITNCHVLRCVKLPANDRYPATHIASLFQERTSDLFHLVCDEAAFRALQVTERDTAVTVEASARQIDLGSSGKAHKLRVVSVRGHGSPAPRSQAAAEDKQAVELHDGDEDGGLVYEQRRRPR